MTSYVNPYFHADNTSEQQTLENMIIESIQLRGKTYYYLSRNLQIEDPILGEDILSKFSLAVPIEMYMVDVSGFNGDREMFSKFGLEIRNSYRLVVSKFRWESEVKAKFDNNLANTEADFDVLVNLRPQEGDLVYDPLTTQLFEIKFVDHDTEFYQLGRNYMYYLSCEAFQYQNESFETGIPEIDLFNDNSRDLIDNQLLTEDGKYLITKDGNSIILDKSTTINTRNYGADFREPAIDIKWNPKNPFGDLA